MGLCCFYLNIKICCFGGFRRFFFLSNSITYICIVILVSTCPFRVHEDSGIIFYRNDLAFVARRGDDYQLKPQGPASNPKFFHRSQSQLLFSSSTHTYTPVFFFIFFFFSKTFATQVYSRLHPPVKKKCLRLPKKKKKKKNARAHGAFVGGVLAWLIPCLSLTHNLHTHTRTERAISLGLFPHSPIQKWAN